MYYDMKTFIYKLQRYIQEFIDSRKAEGNTGKHSDVLSLLIKASEEEKTAAKLTDREIIGKIKPCNIRCQLICLDTADSFIFMLAGYEVWNINYFLRID